jgi:hypothetical protein
MGDIISKPSVRVNNETIAIVPNSAAYTEGEGESDVFAASTGGAGIEVVTSDNAENKLSMCKFDVYATPELVKLARGWKKNPGNNVVEMDGENSEGKSLSRVFNFATLQNDYEVMLQSEGKISLEWKTAQAI